MMKRAGIAVSAVFTVAAYAGCSAPAESPSEEPRVANVSEADLAVEYCTKPLGITSAWFAKGTDCNCTGLTGDQATECAYEQKILSCLHQNAGFPAGCTALPPLPVVALHHLSSAAGVPSDTIVEQDIAADILHLIPGISCSAAQPIKTCIENVNNTQTGWRFNPVTFTSYPYYGNQAAPVSARFTHWCSDTGLGSVCDTEMNMVDIFDPCTVSNCHY
jgi:hypothetical protein